MCWEYGRAQLIEGLSVVGRGREAEGQWVGSAKSGNTSSLGIRSLRTGWGADGFLPEN